MIRKVYLDFIRDKLAGRELRWLLSRAVQYGLLHASYLFKKPFCGPVLGTLVTNYSCNYRCVMCDLRLRDQELRGRGLRELDTAGMKKVLSSFAALGTSGIGFTGGEPLLRKDIFELLAYTKASGMISHLNTNGSLLDEENVRRILAAKVDSLNISLDGARAATHDSLRGIPGAFARAVEGVERVNTLRKREGARLRIKTVAVLQEGNVDEVPDLVRLAEDLGVDCIEFIPRQQFLSRPDRSPAPAPAFLKKIEQVSQYLLGQEHGKVRIENSRTHLRLFPASFRNEPSPLKCYAGYNSLAVDCYGEVYPCVPWYNWRRSAGNVRDKGLADLWYSKGYDEVRREVRSCRSCYLNCQAELNILFDLGASGRIR
jgi:MoaA/NifB/PqqE/SkfB family radical SAM enzyme